MNDCYLTKYRNAAAKKCKIPPDSVDIQDVRNLLMSYKNRDNDIMPLPRIRVFSRQLLWLLEYWHNNYRASCMVYPPHAVYNDKSYYGWMINASSECLPAEEVSLERPPETMSLNKMFQKTWDELGSLSEDIELDPSDEALFEEEEEEKEEKQEKQEARGVKRKSEEQLEREQVKKQRRFLVEKVVRTHSNKYKMRKHLNEVEPTPIMNAFAKKED